MFLNRQGVSYWAIIIVVATMVAALIIAFWPQTELATDNSLTPVHIKLLQKFKSGVKIINEKAKIEKWIVDNKLNEYGDPADTIYAGGTPLFNEATGQMMDRYEYIKMKHPDKPWDK